MGNKCAKCECQNKEVVIQDGNNTEVTTSNILIASILGVCALAIIYIGLKKYKKCHTGLVRQELREEAFRRIRARWSGHQPAVRDPPNPEVQQ